jgi:peptide chain release factor subunit 3
MDDSSISVNGRWSEDRYKDIVGKLTPFLKGCGYHPTKDLAFCPIAALTGGNVLNKPAADFCEWWSGPTLFELLDSTEAPPRDPMASFRMPVMDRYKDMGTVVMGKSESGIVQTGTSLVMMPNAQRCKVVTVWRDDEEVQAAGPGENLRIRLSGIDEDQVRPRQHQIHTAAALASVSAGFAPCQRGFLLARIHRAKHAGSGPAPMFWGSAKHIDRKGEQMS